MFLVLLDIPYWVLRHWTHHPEPAASLPIDLGLADDFTFCATPPAMRPTFDRCPGGGVKAAGSADPRFSVLRAIPESLLT